ncbi:MAG: response regulator [Flavobacteriia bacterium]|nr:response regulator [Flavobacteriia bacterium]
MKTKNKIQVFLVDDDKMFVNALKFKLNKGVENIEISTYFDGENCLQNIDKYPLLVVLDYHLNGDNVEAMNGMQVLDIIKKRSPFSEVIMLSSQDDIEIAMDTLRNGALDYVIKNEECYSKIKTILSQIENEITSAELIKNDSNKVKKITVIIIAIITLLIILSSII